MQRALVAGLIYFAGIFGLAFLLGVIRVLWLGPRIGPFAAVAVELPIVLAASWQLAGALLRRQPSDPTTAFRLTMGLTAFVVLMLVETAMAVVLFHQPIADHFAAYSSPAGALGLSGQILFSWIPLMHGWQRR